MSYNTLEKISNMVKENDELYFNISMEDYKKEHENDIYKTNLLNESLKTSVVEILDFLLLDEDEYERFFEDASYNSEKKKFVYQVIQFIEQTNLTNNSFLTVKQKQRMKELVSYDKLDVEFLGFSFKRNNSLDNIKIDENFRSEILSGMPTDIPDVKKAIYVYIKLCKLLTYDEEFYVFEQNDKVQLKHVIASNVANVNAINNNVVCYEFVALYAKILESIKVDNIYFYGLLDGVFSGKHQKLKAVIDKFLFVADSTTSILQGDLVNAKLNKPLVGLICKNSSKNTVQEFDSMVAEMQTLIVKQELMKLKNGSMYADEEPVVISYALYDRVDEARQKFFEAENFNHLVKIFMEFMGACTYDAMDAIGLALELVNKNLDYSKISISILKDNRIRSDRKEAGVGVVFSVNENGLESAGNKYYYYIPGNNPILIQEDELRDLFENKLIEYMNDEHIIPGLINDDIKIS